jgi:SAM-dependent methyltransferase
MDEEVHAIWSDATIVADYSRREGLTPAEWKVVIRWIPYHVRLLDLGVGVGRTTGILQRRVAHYVGIDYAEPMIQAARERYPSADLRVADAADLSAWEDGSFDVLLFSYNGIDSLHPEGKRIRFLEESRRVLVSDGLLILSTHDPRYLINGAAFDSDLALKRRARLVVTSFLQNAPRLFSRAFWTGRGYQDDGTRRNFVGYAASPRAVRAQLAQRGFTQLDQVASTYPAPALQMTAPWIYYVFRATDRRPPLSV